MAESRDVEGTGTDGAGSASENGLEGTQEGAGAAGSPGGGGLSASELEGLETDGKGSGGVGADGGGYGSVPGSDAPG